MTPPPAGPSASSRIDHAGGSRPGLVSIVVPARLAAAEIGAALDAIGRQSYRSWELIVVEDGSADGTDRVVAEFARRCSDHRIRFVRHPQSLGPAAARNTAFTEARGAFIALLDADDQWLPDHLEASLQRLEYESADIVYSSTVMVDHQSGLPLGIWGPTAEDLARFPTTLLTRNFIVPSATVFRRQVLDLVGGWPSELRWAEDACYWLACVKAGVAFAHLPGVHCLYTKNRPAAATQQVAATATSFAGVVASFLADNPLGMTATEVRSMAAAIYRTAAVMHHKGRHTGDPSADPLAACRLAARAWQLSPLSRRHARLLVQTAAAAVLAACRSSRRAA